MTAAPILDHMAALADPIELPLKAGNPSSPDRSPSNSKEQLTVVPGAELVDGTQGP